MTRHTTTVVVSDLHVGGGTADPGDDHVHHDRQLERFIDGQAASPEGSAGTVELFFNGDFLEFAQVNQGAFSHLSDDCWCTEDESLAKLETMLAGHADAFAALGRFLAAGNAVTIAAGNHDVDLYWPRVQARLREVVGAGLAFELGKEWVERHDGRLQIAHGHMNDPANRFENWADPILHAAWGVPCLEMCPGTLFMVKFVNKLEARYPFADNLLPVTQLVWVLLRERVGSFAAVGWSAARVLLGTRAGVLGLNEADLGKALVARFANDDGARAALVAALDAAGEGALAEALRTAPPTQPILAEAAFALLDRLGSDAWAALFALPPSATLGSGGGGATLSALNQSRLSDGKTGLRTAAQRRIDETGAAVVVMGHTHQPDTVSFPEGGIYYNPGCWTRYLDLQDAADVRLADLEDESRYPYALNYVRVGPAGSGLASEMVCFERGDPSKTPAQKPGAVS